MFDMQVIAFETNPICANDFECNVKQLGLDAKLKVVKEIVSNQDGQLLTLKLTTSKSGMGSVEESFTKKLLGQSRIKRRSFEYVCPSVTLDSLGLKPKIIKIDTEGHDLKVIEGSLNTIEKCHPIIIMEWSNDLVHERPGPIIEALLNMSYRSFLTSSGQGKLLLREIDLEQLLRNFQFKVSNILGNIVFVHKMDFARFTESPKVAVFSEHRAF
jgi:FkbM family methyltransferase